MKFKALSFLLIAAFFTLVGCEETPTAARVVFVNEVLEVTADRYTDFVSLGLPDRVLVTLEDERTLSLPVTWDQAIQRYDATRLGSQTLSGRLILDDTVRNPDQVSVAAVVTLEVVDVMTTLKADPQYRVLVRALESSGLDDAVSIRPSITLLAPTNRAFEEAFNLLGVDEDSFMERDDLFDILLNHVFTPALSRGALLDLLPHTQRSLETSPLAFDFDGTRITVNQVSRIDHPDLEIQNGYVHGINRLIIPQSILQDLVTDLLPSDIIDQFIDLLSDPQILFQFIAGGSSLTILAPNTQAFETFARVNNVSLDQLLDDSDLIELLTYHVLLSQQSTEGLFERALRGSFTLTTLQGENLTVSIEDDRLKMNDAFVLGTEDGFDFATLITLDRVLIPESLAGRFEAVSQADIDEDAEQENAEESTEE